MPVLAKPDALHGPRTHVVVRVAWFNRRTSLQRLEGALPHRPHARIAHSRATTSLSCSSPCTARHLAPVRCKQCDRHPYCLDSCRCRRRHPRLLCHHGQSLCTDRTESILAEFPSFSSSSCLRDQIQVACYLAKAQVLAYSGLVCCSPATSPCLACHW